MKYFILTLLLILLSTSAFADKWSWTKEDTARQLIATSLTVIDWGQTNDIVHRADRIELNPILGTHPTKDQVRNYFLTVLILQPIVARMMPKQAQVFGFNIKPRIAVQYFYIGVESVAISSNYRGGLRVRF